MGLETYHRKRDFTVTAEPKGALSRADRRRFVVQEHHASRLHYDFRLEAAGVLKSWAIPKGPSLNPRHKRLAVMVEDHPVEYINFQGRIAEGHYGAGEVAVWDSGVYEPMDGAHILAGLERGIVSFRLYGEKLRGGFHLVRIAHRFDQWLLIKADDEYTDPDWVLEPVLKGSAAHVSTRGSRASKNRPAAAGTRDKAKRERPLALEERQRPQPVRRRIKTAPRQPGAQDVPLPGAVKASMPSVIEPMRATLVNKPFSDSEWLYETKWDGVRTVCFLARGQTRLFSRKEKEMSFRYPELADITRHLNATQAILDGEIVTLDERGHPNFQLLQARIGLEGDKDIARVAAEHPALYYVFDLVYYNGFDLTQAALSQRKHLLEQILTETSSVQYSRHVQGEGERLFDEVTRAGLEGVVAKHQDSSYVQQRSSAWLKFKVLKRQEVVIGGYTDPRGTRPCFGALVVGLYNEVGALHYIGHVGGGFTHASLEHIYDLIQPLRVHNSPFAEPLRTHEPAHWLKPELICEVKFSEWTADRHMRHPVFMGMRDDKDPRQCIFEVARDTRAEVEHQRTQASRQARTPSPTRSTASPIDAAQAFSRPHLSGDLHVSVDDAMVTLTHLDKIYWPERGYTKGDLLRYYYRIAPIILPYLKDRPLILKRYPNGIHEKPFYQHDVDAAPAFLRTVSLEVEQGRKVDYALCDNLASLLYLVNLGVLAHNPWHSRATRLDFPDWIVFDLDPEGVPFDVVCDVARALHGVLKKIGLESYPKTSGARGMHVYVPIAADYGYQQVADFAQAVARVVERQGPDVITLERTLAKRPAARVYFDHLQNARGKTVVAPYSVRERSAASVSTPLEWHEITQWLSPEDYTLVTIAERVHEKGDLFRDVLTRKQHLSVPLSKLAKLENSA